VAAKIKDGKPISESMAGYPAVFSELYTSLLHTGEASGNISQALNSLAQYLEKEEQFRDSLSSALTYPVFIISVSVMTVVALVGFVIPRIARMFEDMQQALPLPTKILIGSSDFLRHWWWMIAVFLAATIFLFRRTYSNPRQRLQIDEFKLKVPIAGDIILKGQISRLMRALTLLISGGMTIGPSLDIGALTLNNEALKKLVIEFRQEINKGVRLSDVFKKSRYFPEASANIISVGEETGALEKSFSNIADEYEKELDQKVKTFLRLLEPSIILVMGLVVGFIVLSMILPIFQFNLIAG
jgi:type II secretory pathway component PulF